MTKDYDNFLKSETWRKLRWATIWNAGNKCQLCGRFSSNLQVHHNNYNRVGGQERPEDLIALCKQCHERHHGHKNVDDLMWGIEQ